MDKNTTRTNMIARILTPLVALSLVLAADPARAAPRSLRGHPAPRAAAADSDDTAAPESQLAARRKAVQQVTIEPLVDAAAAARQAEYHDIAIVPFKNVVNKHKAGLVYEKTREYFSKRGFKVVPRSQVDSVIKELGLLSTEAIQLNDCDSIARAVGARYLVFGTIKLGKADTGFSPAGSMVSAAQAVTGGLLAVSTLPLVAGGLALSALGGFTATSNADFEARIYDRKLLKIIWVGTESFTAKKHLMAVFTDKRKLQEQALVHGLKHLFDPVVKRLEPVGSKAPIVD